MNNTIINTVLILVLSIVMHLDQRRIKRLENKMKELTNEERNTRNTRL